MPPVLRSDGTPRGALLPELLTAVKPASRFSADDEARKRVEPPLVSVLAAAVASK